MTSRRSTALGVLFLALVPSSASGQMRQESLATAAASVSLAESVSPAEPLSLLEAVALALEHHPAIGEARAQEEVAGGILGVARASRLPSIHSDASLSQHQEPMLVAPLHGFDPTMAPSFEESLFKGNLTLSYAVYDGGARAARIGRAESGEAAAGVGHAMSQMDITARVSAAYLDLLSAGELLGAAENQREALESEFRRVTNFLEAGKAARVDLLRVQAALSQSEAVEISLRTRLDVAMGNLARLTGLPGDEVRSRRLATVQLRPQGPGSPPDVFSQARDASPELSLARYQLTGAAAGVREARANWYPKLHAAGAYSDYASLDGGHTWEWQGSIRLSLPIFTGGSRRAELDRASAEERMAAEALRRTELAVEAGVEEAMAAMTEARSRRSALEEAVEQFQEVARIEALALEVGSGIQTDFLRAQAELFQSRATLVQARHGEILASIQLARVTGELTLTWLQENTEVVR